MAEQNSFGKRLEGLQFSGRTCLSVSKSTSSLSASKHKSGVLGNSNTREPTTAAIRVKLLSRSAPSQLNKVPAYKDETRHRKRPPVDYRVIANNFRSNRLVSETFAENLAIFRKHKQIRQIAARRMSDRLEKRDIMIKMDWKNKLRELGRRQKQLQEKLQEHLAREEDDEKQNNFGKRKLIRRFSDLLRNTGGGLGAVSKWRAKLTIKGLKPKIPPLQRFKGYARLALICVRLCKYSHENVEASRNEYLSIIQVSEDYVTTTVDPEGLYFDPTVFRANKEQRLPTDARKILQNDFRNRTEKEIEYLHLVLRSIKAFAEYPNNMQKKLCQVGWYEAYEPNRAIVRQGQPPHAFYFILSGTVVVTSFNRESGGTTFLVALHKGMSFGELAVINRSKRQATVSTATITEFLCISASDFIEIFMSGGIKSITDPDHNSFIRSIPFLKDWPIECLATNPQACMFHFFPRGQVLVRDSNHSDWIYVVKSGSLSVLKKLVEVQPRKSRRDSDSDSGDEGRDTPRSNRTFGTWDFRIKKKKRLASTGEKQVFKNNIEMEKRLEQTLPGFYNNRDRLGIIDYEEIITDHKSRVLQTNRRSSIMVDPSTLPKITVQATDPPVTESPSKISDDVEASEDDKAMKLPKIRKTSKHVLWKEPEVKSVSVSPPVQTMHLLHVPSKFPKGAYLASMKNVKKKSSRKEAMQEELFQRQIEYDKKLLDDRKIGRKTITDELDNKMIKDFTLTEKDIRPMFVQVQILERGQYFGLTKTVFPEQAESFSVVSNGAECIMISKKFFLERANENTMYHLRQVETLLPPEEELQTNLQDFVDWKAHRVRVYNRLVKNKSKRNVLKRQFPPQYGGEYCFRTGPTIRID